jgi:tol-pal system protein YbgF
MVSFKRTIFQAPLFFACAWQLIACGHTGTEKGMLEMQDTITRLQRDRDTLEPSAALESSSSSPNATKSVPPKPSAPKVAVVRIAPEEEDESEPPDAPRPVIKITGQGGPAPTRRGTKRSSRDNMGRAEDKIDVQEPPGSDAADTPNLGRAPVPGDSTQSTAPASGAKEPSAFDPLAKKAYDEALSMVYGKRFDEALEAFAAFLVKWPDHPNADNAHYWRGECYFAKGEFAKAAEQFSGVVTQFPLGNKVPDALLKLAAARTKLGQTSEAKEALAKLQREYPRSEAARKAKSNP